MTEVDGTIGKSWQSIKCEFYPLRIYRASFPTLVPPKSHWVQLLLAPGSIASGRGDGNCSPKPSGRYQFWERPAQVNQHILLCFTLPLMVSFKPYMFMQPSLFQKYCILVSQLALLTLCLFYLEEERERNSGNGIMFLSSSILTAVQIRSKIINYRR